MREAAVQKTPRLSTQEVQSPMPAKYTAQQSIDAFWSKVDFTDTCWLWEAVTVGEGYGQTSVSGTKEYAHRWAYQFCVGTIPEGLVIDHLCRVTRCVNPDHLEAVTNRENVLRYTRLITHCIAGHQYNYANTAYRLDGTRRCRECSQTRWR